MAKLIDLTGQRFGRLTVIEHSHKLKRQSGCTSHFWKCVCDCGNMTAVLSQNIRRGTTLSCGCLAIEQLVERRRSHGMAGSPEYISWQAMKRRCSDPNNSDFYMYGLRGIKVCAEWNNSFEAFFSDMGKRPSRKHSLDRINTNGNYEPSNCRWATPKEQSNNTRRNVFYEFDGRRQTISQWAREIDVPHQRIAARIHNLGWSIERALTTKKYGG